MSDEVRGCGCDNNCGCGNNGFLGNLFGGCGSNGDSTILFFIIIFLLLFCNCGNNNGCGR